MPTSALPRLFLVRHGDTAWTDSQRHTGLTDIPLNANGEERARQLATRLAKETFVAVFASPLMRARRTCELAGFASRATVDTNLCEWNYGDFEGKTSAEIHDIQPDWNLFSDGAPGGESPAQVAGRADQFLNVVRPIAGDVLAFSSGHMIRMIAARWLGLSILSARCFFTGTASIGILGYEHSLAEPVVRLWNDSQPLNPTH